MKFFCLGLLALIFFNLLGCEKGNRPAVIAHRGASGYLPENTLEAAILAHSMGADFLEADLVMSKDGHLVVLHDLYLDTTTNAAILHPEKKRDDGRYYAIDFTLDEIKSLSVNERVNPQTGKKVYPNRFPLRRASFQVPSFREFIELVQGLNQTTGKNIGIYPEIKKPEFHLAHNQDITKALIHILREFGYEENHNAYIQCFWPQSLKRLKEEFKTKIPLIQLIAEDSWGESSSNYTLMLGKKGLKEIASYAQGIGPYLHHIISPNRGSWDSTGVVEAAKAYGLLVHPYTHRLEEIPPGLNEKQFFKLLFERLEVDGVFSDFPDRVLR